MRKTTKNILFILAFLVFILILLGSEPVFATDAVRITDGIIYNIRNNASGKCLNVNLGTDANGTNVIQWTKDGSQEQKFRVVYYENEAAYRIYAMCSSKGGGRVIDVLRTGGSASGTIQSGNNVDIWMDGDDDCQFFIIQSESIGKYSIRLRYNTNLALTVYGTGNGSGAGNTSTSTGNVYISTWTGSSNQLWSFEEITATPAYPYYMTKGIGNQTYYIDSTANIYTSFIAEGAARWNPTVIFSQASNNSSTAVDFYSTDNKDLFDYIRDLGDYWGAATTYHYPGYNPILYPDRRGWGYAKVTINNNIFPKTSYSDEQRRSAITHEIGHAFGLKHYNVLGSIMYPSNAADAVTSPQNIDRNGLLYKY